MSFSKKGVLQKKLDVQIILSKAGKEWNKRHFIVDTGDQFNNIMCFELFGDKVDLIENIQEGTEIEVLFNIQCRENQKNKGDFFVSLSAWAINTETSIEQSAPAPNMQEPPTVSSSDDSDDLPF